MSERAVWRVYDTCSKQCMLVNNWHSVGAMQTSKNRGC